MPRHPAARPIHVHKFGGASLADAAALSHAASIIALRPGRRVVVVSAMAGVTDVLLDGAQSAADGDSTDQAAGGYFEKSHAVASRDLGEDWMMRKYKDALAASFKTQGSTQ